MLISIIVAMGENRVIGIDNRLPWCLPADLKHFKQLTLNKPIIMGRKTYESMGKPLPERRNIIITGQQSFEARGCEKVSSLTAALNLVKECSEVMIIGGASIYAQALEKADYLYLTIVHHEFAGDTYFPVLDKRVWREVNCEKYKADKNNPYDYSFILFKKMQ